MNHDAYVWLKALHIISVISWMAGLFYLPRLLAYHADAKPNSDQAKTFETMERRLLRIIMNPAMVLTWVFGIWILFIVPGWLHEGWLHAKFGLVLFLTVYHHFLARWRKDFLNGANRHSAKFYKIMNEVPTLLMIGIVIFVVVKPF